MKVHRRVPRDDYFAVAQEAKAQGLTLVGHIPLTVSPEEASDAGQLIEHTETMFEGTFATALGGGGDDEPMLSPKLPEAMRQFRERGADALFARFARNHTSVTPTLRIMQALIDPTRGLTDARLRYVPRSLRDAASKSTPLTAEQREVCYEQVEALRSECDSAALA